MAIPLLGRLKAKSISLVYTSLKTVENRIPTAYLVVQVAELVTGPIIYTKDYPYRAHKDSVRYHSRWPIQRLRLSKLVVRWERYLKDTPPYLLF